MVSLINRVLQTFLFRVFFLFLLTSHNSVFAENSHRLAYLVSDLRIPFWDIMARGIQSQSKQLGYDIVLYSAQNNAKQELQNTVEAIKNKVDGLIISPTNSSASVTILQLAKKAGIPVVISDIGTESGEYVSFIASDNRKGAYDIGKVLTDKMHSENLQNGSVGIIGIPQRRLNGQLRTAGFLQALDEAKIKSAGIFQQSTFSYQETYDFSKQLIQENSDLKAIWLQGSDRYQAAFDAINDEGENKNVLLISFDAEPIFLELIPEGKLVGAAMQQPFYMGEMSVKTLDTHLQGGRVEKNQLLPIIAVSQENIASNLSLINRNVLGKELP